MTTSGPVVLLAGGVGGAKLAHGLQARLGSRLVVIVNTADDVERHGLLVSPDHDTVMYTLAGIANREWGWGIEGETFGAAGMLERYGEEAWFRLGDRDLATHVVRTARLRRGDRPTDVSRALQRALDVQAVILPMTDARVRTEVLTDEGWLEFQDYFVRQHQAPEVRDLRFTGIEDAAATPEVEAALEAAEAIVIAPSNPFVSVRPILAVAGVDAGVQTRTLPWRPGRCRLRDRRRQGPQGPSRPDAHVAGPRAERARGRPAVHRDRRRSSCWTRWTPTSRGLSPRSGCARW